MSCDVMPCHVLNCYKPVSTDATEQMVSKQTTPAERKNILCRVHGYNLSSHCRTTCCSPLSPVAREYPRDTQDIDLFANCTNQNANQNEPIEIFGTSMVPLRYPSSNSAHTRDKSNWASLAALLPSFPKMISKWLRHPKLLADYQLDDHPKLLLDKALPR